MHTSRVSPVVLGAFIQIAPVLAISAGLAQPATGGTVKPLFSVLPTDLSGKRLTVVEVDYPPGGTTPGHHHPGSVFAYVLSGSVRSQIEGESEPKVFTAGQSWYEPPGAHHIVSGNASTTEPARLLAVLVGDDAAPLVTPDSK